MPIHQCCVDGCKSRKPDVKLFNLPAIQELRDIWLHFLMPWSKLLRASKPTKEILIQKKVCTLHFEEKYLTGNKRKRLACPTLFTEDEILRRKPSTPVVISLENVAEDHNYSFGIAENTPRLSALQLTQNEIEDITMRLKQMNHDHTYDMLGPKIIFKPDGSDLPQYTHDPKPHKRVPDSTSNVAKKPVVTIAQSGKERNYKEKAVSKATEDEDHTDYIDLRVDEHDLGETDVDQELYDGVDDSTTNIDEKPVLTIAQSGKKRYNKEKAVSKATEDEDLTDYIDLKVDKDDLGETDVDQEMYDGVDDAEQPKEDGPFSWQKLTEEAVPLDEKQYTEDVKFLGESQLVPVLCDPEEIQIQVEFSCNVCSEPITGFRYACVQCSDWDLCGACEARGEHATHYVLRVPPHRTLEETQRVLTALRQMLDGLALHEDPSVPVIKDEVKTEDPLCDNEAPQEPRAEPAGDAARASGLLDPLGAAVPAASEDEIYEAEYLETESEASMSLGEDSMIDADVPRDAVCISHQKRKLNGAGHSYTVPQKLRKRNDQGSLTVHYDNNTREFIFETVSKVSKKIPSEDISVPQRESFDSGAPQIQLYVQRNAGVTPHTETNNLIALHRETDSFAAANNLIQKSKQNQNLIAPQTRSVVLDDNVNNIVLFQCPTESSLSVENVMELSSLALSASEAQYVTLDGQPLEVIDCSKDLRVNVTRLTEEEIRSVTGPRGGKR